MKSLHLVPLLLLVTISRPKTCEGQHLFSAAAYSRPERTYDVLHYKLDLRFNEPEKMVMGTTEISFQPLHTPLDSVWFDAVNMDIADVTTPGNDSLRCRNDGSILTIFMDRSYSHQETIMVRISYSCRPEKGLYFIQTDSTDLTRRNQIWTQGEESDNRYWFPCYDAPDDKSTSEIIATVRDSYFLLSNGRLVSESLDLASGTKTFHWKQQHPHSSYLVMIAAGEYLVVPTPYGNLPVSHYVYPADSVNAAYVFRNTPDMIRFFEELIGYPYPWEKYTHVIVDQFMWGGMENTSAVTLNELYMFDRRSAIDTHSDDVIAHEMAHQWWGDLITCSDWTHLWLNEGFANYFEALYKRHARGEDEFQYEAYASSSSIRRQEETLGRKPIVSIESYGVNLYSKGAWVLRMLSDLLGEERFIAAIRHYARKHQFESVTTREFQRAVEESSGDTLGWFFDQWVYGGGHPQLEVTTTWESSNSLLRVAIRQVQESDSVTGVFRFPLEIDCVGGDVHATHRVLVDEAEEEFLFPLDGEPDIVIIDSGLKVLKTLRQEKSKEEWISQLAGAAQVPSRLDALDGLSEVMGNSDVFDAVRRAALHDPFREVRVAAIALIGSVMDDPENVREVLLETGRDRDPRVREAAVNALERFGSPVVAGFLEQVAYTDSSDRVRSACIRALPSMDSLRAFSVASRHVYSESHRDGVRRASLNTLRSLKDSRGLAFGMHFTNAMYEVPTRLSALGLVRETGKGDLKANILVREMLTHPNDAIRSSAVRTLAQWGGDENRIILEDKKNTEKDEDVLKVIDESLKEWKSE